jgi:transcriptional regulator with XRE-family HTH domain
MSGELQESWEGDLMISPGPNLRTLREKLGLTPGDVETATERLTRKHNNEDYLITAGRLSDIETKGVIPSVHRLYSLAIIYRREFGEMLSWYGVDLNQTASDLEEFVPPRTHFSHALPNTAKIEKPIRIDPDFDPRTTLNFAPMIRQWGAVPVAYLQQLSKKDYSYGYIGSEDLTMHPILPPGSFIQVDESRNKVLKGGWRSEYERPIYFVETREGYTCSWCTTSREELILLPHPLSPALPTVLPAQETEVIGQVIGVAMRVGELQKEENNAEDHENRQ